MSDFADFFVQLDEEAMTPERQAIARQAAEAREEVERQEAESTRTTTIDSWVYAQVEQGRAWLVDLLDQLTPYQGIEWTHDSKTVEVPENDGSPGDGRQEVEHVAEGEAISSALREVEQDPIGYHLLALDIDHQAALVPSSTAGHSHLIIHHWLTEEAWREIVAVLGKHGVIEDNYAQVSLKRGATFLRLPWVRKGYEKWDRIAAHATWLLSDSDFVGYRGRAKWYTDRRKAEEEGARMAALLADPGEDPF